ncbi:UvrD-helicase domain-containing protein [Campylobacter sp. JMF_03 NE3]|uniref:UvrD-helicase domain-containing protein n=1 Tax=Campylobacter sp. JMF_03 NE3 TaxID=2983831 RepID=UPI0022E9DA03|nr:UvrD-helicase domain-containing protein [Campylobacter sp. JMF_03 NE3]MDA3053612.1 UvrD-helicase domain-containing protein [Campylobacter sp. JMF_03 NE3]
MANFYNYEYTPEQQKIIDEIDNMFPQIPHLLINSSAGSGKTFSAKAALANYFTNGYFNTPISERDFVDWGDNMEYTYSIRRKALYLVFNKAMQSSFAKSIKNMQLEVRQDEIVKLSDIVDTKTYHSFMKNGENMATALTSILQISNIDEIKINYAKGSLNKNDIDRICRNIANYMYDFGAIEFVSEEETKKTMLKYAEVIKPQVEKFIDTYFKTALSSKSSINLIKDYFEKNNINISELVCDTLNKDKLNKAIAKFGNGDNNSFFNALIIKALDKGVRDSQIEVSHDYYYKKIYEHAMSNMDFLLSMFRKYDMIIIDEAQDADEMMFSLTKRFLDYCKTSPTFANTYFLAFGDPKQSIYGFKGSFNIFEWAEKNSDFFQNFALSHSFRYGENIAKFAKLIVNNYHGKDQILGNEKVKDYINPQGLDLEGVARFILNDFLQRKNEPKSKFKHNTAMIFRTNNGCIEAYKSLKETIKGLLETDEFKECGYDVENIVLDPEIKKDVKEIYKKSFLEFIKFDGTLGLNSKSYLKSKNIDITNFTIANALKDDYIRELISKSLHFRYLVKYNESFLEKMLASKTKANADFIITNVHQSKGKEYKNVILGDDFFKHSDKFLCNKEEDNIVHTALTRAKKYLGFYESAPNSNIIKQFYDKQESPSENSNISFVENLDIKKEVVAVLNNSYFEDEEEIKMVPLKI